MAAGDQSGVPAGGVRWWRTLVAYYSQANEMLFDAHARGFSMVGCPASTILSGQRPLS